MVPTDTGEGNRGVAMTTASRTTQMVRSGISRTSRVSCEPRVHRRTRLVSEVAALVLIAALLVALPMLSRGATNDASSATMKVTARPGDTLWSVARTYPVPGMTTPEAVDHIAALNGFESSRIPVGSSIVVPIASEGVSVAFN